MSSKEAPQEIAWRLVGTTAVSLSHNLSSIISPSSAGSGGQETESFFVSPSLSTISLLIHSPKEEDYSANYPSDRLLYLKVPISLCSDINQILLNNELKSILNDNYPIWSSIVDMHIEPMVTGQNVNLPYLYFSSATPLKREVIESGSIGNDALRVGSSGVAIGKSLTQLHESSNTASETTTWNAGGGIDLGFISFGGGGGGSRTDVTSNLDRVQKTDNIQRNASEERKELHSYHSEISNLLTILNSSFVGTSYLQFTLRPRPIHIINYDPADPYSWYTEFIRRRSAGLQGIQDFYTIAVIPKNVKEFCITISLRNMYVYDSPPAPPEVPNHNYKFSQDELSRILAYLFRRYPIGTPIEELDFDFGDDIQQIWGEVESKKIRNACVIDWTLFENQKLDPAQYGFGPYILTPLEGGSEGDFDWASILYKSAAQLKLEMYKFDYMKSLKLSPLERGIVFYIPFYLTVCFAITENGEYLTKNIKRKIGKPVRLPKPESSVPYWIEVPQSATNMNPIATFTRWSNLESLMPTRLINDSQKIGFSFSDPEILNTTVSRWISLPVNDPRNNNLSEVSKTIGLSEKIVSELSVSGITNLKSIGQMIENVRIIDGLRTLNGIKIVDTSKTSRDVKKIPIKSFLEQSDTGKIDVNNILKEISKGLDEKLEDSISKIQKLMDSENILKNSNQ
jgi:hypothetical protein